MNARDESSNASFIVRLPRDVLAEVRVLARRQDQSMSRVVRDAVTSYVESRR